VDTVAVALASGATTAAAAKKGGVCERTVRSWMSQPRFRARVDRLRGEAVSSAVALLSKDMVSAAQVLKKLMRSQREDVRLRAARAVLELGVRLRDEEELRRRVEELERRLAGAKS
jgi:transposase-like protein